MEEEIEVEGEEGFKEGRFGKLEVCVKFPGDLSGTFSRKRFESAGKLTGVFAAHKPSTRSSSSVPLPLGRGFAVS